MTASEFISQKDKAVVIKPEKIIDYTQGGKLVNIGDVIQSEPQFENRGLIPQLKFNMQKVTDLTQDDILKMHDNIKRSKSQLEAVSERHARLLKRKEQEQKQEQRLEELLAIVEDLEKRTSRASFPQFHNGTNSSSSSTGEGELSLDELEEKISLIQNKYRHEYMVYGLSGLVVSLVFPILRNYLRNWNPLENPDMAKEVVSRWRYLLAGDTGSSQVNK